MTVGRRLRGWLANLLLAFASVAFVLALLMPPVAVVVMHSVIYDGWRHLYFIYPAFLFVATLGFATLYGWARGLNYRPAVWVFLGVTAVPLVYTVGVMAAGHPHCYVASASVGYPIDLMNKVRKGLNHKGAAFLLIYTPCQKGFVYETPRSIDLGRLVVECGLYPIWEWNPEKREYDYSFRPQSMRPVAEYLKLQGRFGHLHAEHIATLQRFANEQWSMMGVELPEALVRAADAKNLSDMAAAEAAAAIAETV